MMKHLIYIIALLLAVPVAAREYVGRVLTPEGEGIGYATVYPVYDPVAGTATNNEGYFKFETNLPPECLVIVSFLGYEKVEIPLGEMMDSVTIVLKEQPIALEETVVAAKASKQRNKRKQMASLLHSVYVQMCEDFSAENAEYKIVSDVRMDSDGEAWGMEQMIAKVVNLPEAGSDGRDSVQFAGEWCKRYFKPEIRQLADTIYKGDALEKAHKDARKMATAIDSGVVVHQGLWQAGNIRYDFEKYVSDLKHWSVSNESEGETVLTHIEKHNYLGIVKYSITRNYILDSETLSVRRFSEKGEIYINIPFGYKLSKEQVLMLNLLNMDDQQIEKFRLRKAEGMMQLNTIYQRQNGHLYILEKNMRADANVLGTKQMEIPVKVRATQRVTSLKTEDVEPLKKGQMTRRVKRQIVEVY